MAAETRKLEDNAVYSNALAAAQLGEKPTYNGSFENQLNDIYGKIANREKFSYDVNADPLYQSYKDQYIQQGKLAMKDTMGQAAALTGGYGNTYGQQVGQQAYNAYLQNLSAVIPQLYGMAYEQYRDEGDQLNNLYDLAGRQRDLEYSRYRDELGDWENNLRLGLENERYEREWGRQAEQEEYDRQQAADAIARQLEQQQYDRRMQQEAIDRQLEQQQYERQKYAEQVERDQERESYERDIYAQKVARDLENQAYTRRMQADEIAREQEQQDYTRRMAAEQIARQQEQQEYERKKYDEQVARQLEQQEYERKKYEDQTAYNREQDAYTRTQAESETAYKKQQQAYSNLYALIKSSGYSPTDSELREAGMTREAANALAAEYQRSITPTSYGGSTGSTGSRGSSGHSSNPAPYTGATLDYDIAGDSDYAIWEEAVNMARADGADAWDINTIVQQSPDLSVQEKRNLMVSGVDSVNWDAVGDNGRYEYVNHNDIDNVMMNQVAPNNTAYENVMNNVSSTDDIIAKIRNKNKKSTFRTDRLE